MNIFIYWNFKLSTTTNWIVIPDVTPYLNICKYKWDYQKQNEKINKWHFNFKQIRCDVFQQKGSTICSAGHQLFLCRIFQFILN